MSTLPAAVRKQIAEADQLAKDYYASLGKTNGEALPDPNAVAPVDGEAPPSGEAPPTEDTGEHRYKVLQGKYNNEVPRLQRQVNEQTGMIQHLQSQLDATQTLLASLNAQRESAPVEGSTPTPVSNRLVKDEEIREFGPDLIDVVRRVAREENLALLPEIDRRVQPVVQRVDQTAQYVQRVGQRVARNDQQSVHTLLTDQVPNWQELNGDSGFLEWLEQVDPYSGHKRGALLDQAYRSHNGPRVVAFFQGYIDEHAVVTPPATAVAPTTPQKRLGDFVAPGTPKTGAAGTPDGSGKRVWARKDISDFYRSLQAGTYKGTAEQRRATEADIFAAQRENRIR